MTDEAKGRFGSIAEALAAAEGATNVEDVTRLPDGVPGESTNSVDVDTSDMSEDAEVGIEQTADADEEQIPQKLADLLKVVEEQPEEDSLPDLSDDTVVVVNGEKKTLKELKEGNLRHDDYTQKTQEIADQRRELGRAADLWELLRADPVSTIAQLALEAQLIDDEQFQALTVGRPKASEVQSGFLQSQTEAPSETDIEALVAAKVAEVLGKDEAIAQLQKQQRQGNILSSLKALEGKYNLSLDDADRAAVLQTAVDMRETNLEVVLLRMLHQVESSQKTRDRVKGAAGGKLNSTTAPKTTSPKAKSIRESWTMAEAALNN